MKKVFTLFVACLMTSLSIDAQSLQVLDKLGNVVTNGQTIICGGPVSGTGVARLDVKNSGESTLNVMAKKQVLVADETQYTMFCWKNCYAPFVTNPEDTVILKSDSIFPAFTADFITPAGNYNSMQVRYTFFVAENRNDSVSVTLQYLPSSFAMKHETHEVSSGNIIDVMAPLTAEGAIEVELQNMSAASADVSVRRTDLATIEDASSYFCWKNCYAPSVMVSPEDEYVTIDPQAISNNFSAHYLANNHFGSVVSRYTFFDKRNPADSAWFIVRFTAEGTGVNDPGTSMLPVAYPNPASDFISLNFKDIKASFTLSLINLTGSVVKSVTIDPNTVNYILDVADVPSGLYFYSLSSAGKIVSSKKIVITR